MKNMFKKFMLQAITLGSFFLIVLVVTPSTFADTNQVCNPDRSVFQKIQDAFNPDIRRTTMDNLSSAVSDFAFHAATGGEISEFMGCLDYINKNFEGLVPAEITSYNCNQTSDELCASLINQYKIGFNLEQKSKFANSQTAGSLLGFAYMVDNYMQYEPIPVNTAYFFNDYGRRLPIVGDKVFAATTVDYQHTLINSMLDGWKITRNISYALMSIIMLWVGIAIITRQKISQQVVVNVQYALPKIVVALILIAFSYPIGATIASLSWSLWNSVPTMVASLGGGGLHLPDPAQGTGTWVAYLVVIIANVLSGMGVGLAVGIMIVILAVVYIIMLLMVLIKALFIFFKMLGSILFAPIQFAFAAIPGNDSKIVDWFKQMAVWCLGLVGMRFVIEFTFIVVGAIVGNGVDASDYFTGSLFLVLGTPLLCMFGFGMALKAPDMIQNAIMGPPAKKK